jgi:multiple sugar transport system ATP-binding protein
VGAAGTAYAQESVATFVGTPEMNVLDLRLEQGRLRGGKLSIPIAVDGAEGAVKAGIRPDHVEVLGVSTAGETSGDFSVEVCEHLGTTSLLIGTLDGQRLRVLTTRTNAQPGDRLAVRLPAERMHVFDANGECRLN